MTVRFEAVLGPWLRTTVTYESPSPTATGSGDPEVSIATSACGLTVTTKTEVLLAELFSGRSEATVALFVVSPVTVVMTRISILAVPSLSTGPRVQVTTLPELVHEPCVDTLEMN